MAKQCKNLFKDLCKTENLFLAYRKAAKGKRGRPEVAAFEFELERNLLELQGELVAKSYQTAAYSSFYIYDPKYRLVSAAPFRDRVMHHVLVNILEPIYERRFIADSYANRKGKGTHCAIARAQAFSRRYRYVLQVDVRQFFASIDHQILRAILARKITDPDVMWLIDVILEGGEGVLDEEYTMVYFPGDDLFAINRPRGLPIGNLTSQFWANVYLDQLDQFVKRQLHCRAYVRFVDDCLFFDDDKRRLWALKGAVRDLLAGLRLTLHERSSTVYPVEQGIPFLGFRIYPTHRRLKRRNGVAFARRLRRYQRSVAAGRMSLDAYLRSVRGWLAHAQHGDTWGLRRALLRTPIPLRGS